MRNLIKLTLASSNGYLQPASWKRRKLTLEVKFYIKILQFKLNQIIKIIQQAWS